MSSVTEVRSNPDATFQQRWLLATLLTGVTALCAQLAAPLPFTPVPVTMQVFAVLLSGLLLGGRWGAVAQAQYLALGMLGAPVFALGHSAPALFGPTGGYLWSYPVAAFLVGWIAERATRADRPQKQIRGQLLACGVGLGVIYSFGCAWLALHSQPMLSLPMAFVLGAGWFLFWDAVKALAAVGIANAWKRRG